MQGGHSKATEGDLVRLLKTGSQVAFREFVERHQSRVFKVTCGILGSRQAADEVAQRVFVKVHCSIQRFDGRYSLVAWLHRIAVNESYSFLRNKRPELSREDGSARELVNRLLERIPEDDRHLLLMKELEGYSVADLSEATGVNEGAIRLRLFRTRQRLARAAAESSTNSLANPPLGDL